MHGPRVQLHHDGLRLDALARWKPPPWTVRAWVVALYLAGFSGCAGPLGFTPQAFMALLVAVGVGSVPFLLAICSRQFVRLEIHADRIRWQSAPVRDVRIEPECVWIDGRGWQLDRRLTATEIGSLTAALAEAAELRALAVPPAPDALHALRARGDGP